MQTSKIFLLFGFASLVFSACKKQDVKNAQMPPQEETCRQTSGASNGDPVTGRYIVLYNTDIIQARSMSQERLEQTSTDILDRNAINEEALEANFGGDAGGFIAELSAEEATRLKRDESIKIVEQDRIISLATCFTVAEPRLITWNINRVGFGDGTGKTAWVVDTGIDFEHPDLNVDVARSKSFLPNVPSADDENGHGTHVAGVIGAKNNSIGTLGVASGAKVVSLRVLDKNGTGLLSYIVQALAYINANAKAGDVVNMSLGDDEGISTSLDEQVQATAERGIYFAIAAGNENDLANKFSPARASGPNIFTISAIDSLDNFASFSNYGNDVVDYAAPGVRILSSYLDNKYAYMSGTSMAAPHMAGLLLLRGRNITTSGTAKNDPDGTPDQIAHY